MKEEKKSSGSKKPRSMKPTSPEARENQMISLAIDLAEKQLREGTASSQVVSFYLKLGASKEKLEKEILEKKKELLEAQTESIRSEKRIEELYGNAINAMREYQGVAFNNEY